MNQLGTVLLYLRRLCRSIRLSLSNRTPGIERQKIDFDSYVELLELHMCRTQCINYVNVFFNIIALLIGYLVDFRACAGRTHRSTACDHAL